MPSPRQTTMRGVMVSNAPVGSSNPVYGREMKSVDQMKLDLKNFFEDRWERGVVRDFTAPDLWGNGYQSRHPKKYQLAPAE